MSVASIWRWRVTSSRSTSIRVQPQQSRRRRPRIADRSKKMNLPKLSKGQIQKLALSVMGFVFLLYVYFTFFLGPLNKSRSTTLATIEDRQKKLDSSKSEMVKA